MNENHVAATAAKQMLFTVHLCQGQCLKPTTIATIFWLAVVSGFEFEFGSRYSI